MIDENKIDGKFIKNLDHGCGIPDKALFRKELPLMLEKSKENLYARKFHLLSLWK
nr:DUF2920 family protein [Campylobacter jejuni]